jgi:hypothetical protein
MLLRWAQTIWQHRRSLVVWGCIDHYLVFKRSHKSFICSNLFKRRIKVSPERLGQGSWVVISYKSFQHGSERFCNTKGLVGLMGGLCELKVTAIVVETLAYKD